MFSQAQFPPLRAPDSKWLHAALCFVEADWSMFAKPFMQAGVWVTWPRRLADMIAESGPIEQPFGFEGIIHIRGETSNARRFGIGGDDILGIRGKREIPAKPRRANPLEEKEHGFLAPVIAVENRRPRQALIRRRNRGDLLQYGKIRRGKKTGGAFGKIGIRDLKRLSRDDARKLGHQIVIGIHAFRTPSPQT